MNKKNVIKNSKIRGIKSKKIFTKRELLFLIDIYSPKDTKFSKGIKIKNQNKRQLNN